MADLSEEELVGDVDMDFDEFEATDEEEKKKGNDLKKGNKTKYLNQQKETFTNKSGLSNKKKVGEKCPVSQSKQPVKRKIDSSAGLSNDFLLAFSVLPSVKKGVQQTNKGEMKEKHLEAAKSAKVFATSSDQKAKTNTKASSVTDKDKIVSKEKKCIPLSYSKSLEFETKERPEKNSDKDNQQKEKMSTSNNSFKCEIKSDSHMKERIREQNEPLIPEKDVVLKSEEKKTAVLKRCENDSIKSQVKEKFERICDKDNQEKEKAPVTSKCTVIQEISQLQEKLSSTKPKTKTVEDGKSDIERCFESSLLQHGKKKELHKGEALKNYQNSKTDDKKVKDLEKEKHFEKSQEKSKTESSPIEKKEKKPKEEKDLNSSVKVKKQDEGTSQDKGEVLKNKQHSRTDDKKVKDLEKEKDFEKSQEKSKTQSSPIEKKEKKPKEEKDLNSSVKVKKLYEGTSQDKKATSVSNRVYSEMDYKSMDNYLVEQMVIKLELENKKNGGKYKVHMSPLEIADLGHPSIQQLIQLHPTLSLVFQHQAVKLKKKKGYGEAVFRTVTDLKEFVYQLTQVKVCERCLYVSISNFDLPDFSMSFKINLNHTRKLMDLINSGEDPVINKPVPIDKSESSHKVMFEKVPSVANAAFMHSLFPFTNNVHISKQCIDKKTAKSKYYGPLTVCYINENWLDAVMACCTDFAVNDFPLTVIKCTKPGEKNSSEEKDDVTLTSLTQEVYAEVVESIRKLKEMEPSDRSMKEILKVQNRLDGFQSSLKTSNESILSDILMENDTEKQEKTAMEKLEEKYEEAEKIRHEKELSRKRQLEREMDEKKEFEKKRKTMWAKSLISDFKQRGPVTENFFSKGAELLRQRQQRIKEKEKEAEIMKEEEEKRRQHAEEEEKRKEEEKILLIQRIEEARRRDMQKAELLSSSQSIWKIQKDNDSTPRDRRNQGRRQAEASAVDDDVDQRLDAFARELEQQGKIDAPARESPVHGSHYNSQRREKEQDANIIEEDEYEVLKARRLLHTLPKNCKVMIKPAGNRYCPATGCPATRCFKEFSTLMDHWFIFHEPKSTMRFCPNCTAYFMKYKELESHMMKAHTLSAKEAIYKSQNARVKVIPNPSYRDPSPFIAPDRM